MRPSRNATLASGLAALVLVAVVHANEWTPPIPVSVHPGEDLTERDEAPELATDGTGTWIAVWKSQDVGDGSIVVDSDIRFSRSTDNGATWIAPAYLNSNAATDTGDDYRPAIATDGNGVWVVAWESHDSLDETIGTDGDILYVRSTDNGVTWTAPAPLNSNAATDSGSDQQVALATGGNGVWIAVWSSNENLGGTIGTDRDLLYARSTDHGVTWSAPAPLNSNAATDGGYDEYPAIATDAFGNWIVCWQSNDSLGGTISNDDDVLYARSTDHGVTWSAPAPLNTNAATDTGGDYEPTLAVDGIGTWIAAWVSNDSLGGTIGTDSDVLYARSTDSGATWSAPAPLNSNAATDAGSDSAVRLATDGGRNWVAVWMSKGSLEGSLNDWDILFARSENRGVTWSAPAALNSNAASDIGDDYSPAVTTDGLGTWIALWDSNDELGGMINDDWDIFCARMGAPAACGSVFWVNAAEAGIRDGDGRFRAAPKLQATFVNPVTGKPGKAAAKVLTKVDKAAGNADVRCEWTKRIRLYNAKDLKTAQALGASVLDWLPGNQRNLALDVRGKGKELPGGAHAIRPLTLAQPVITGVVDDFDGTLQLMGKWFGTKTPKVWREFEVPAKGGGVMIKRQAVKVVKPTIDNTAFRDAREKPAAMNADDGDSNIRVIVPVKDPKGTLNHIYVIDNGVGLAAFDTTPVP
jgi:hypothetical protein